MLHKKTAFLRILVMELEDLDEDINLLCDEYREKYDHEQISKYVFWSNLATMQNEMFGVEGFIEDVKETSPYDFDTLEDLVGHLTGMMATRVKQKGLAPALIGLVDRKIQKVLAYVEQ